MTDAQCIAIIAAIQNQNGRSHPDNAIASAKALLGEAKRQCEPPKMETK